MIVLDCESLDSAYESIQSIFGLSRQTIDEVFAAPDFERLQLEHGLQDEPHLLFERFKAESSSQFRLDAVYWFHLSRVQSPNAFESGILPLRDQVDNIWDSLRLMVADRISDSEWAEFRKEMGDSDSAFLYHLKRNDPDHWGPYGVLVRDVAFCPTEIGNHDYLDMPEIVEDISLCFEDRYGFDLRSAFTQNSKPCIVKFVDTNPHERCFPPALYYLYSRFHGGRLSLSCNTCFDGRGSSVRPEQIHRIEFPHYVPVEIKTQRAFPFSKQRSQPSATISSDS
jgi:hypothetical protein